MNDTISRQAAIEAINRAVTKEVARWSVEELPSAEVEPVKRGRWIDDGFYADYYGHHEYRCSECGECYIDYEMEWHYCPNCGAKMEPISASPENGQGADS